MQFRDKCPQRSTGVSVENDYKKYRSRLAVDFNHRCGYCNDLDNPRKEYFEIDHFVPKDVMNKMKDNVYSNLVYAVIHATMPRERNGQVAMKTYH